MKQFTPSPTASIFSRAAEMKKAGANIYNFAAGDPIIENDPEIIKEAESLLAKKTSPYAPVAGLPELRQAAADWMNRRYGSAYSLDETLVTPGGKFALYMAFQVLLEPGDEVLIPAPYWVSFPEMVRMAGGVPKFLPTKEENGWKISPADLKPGKILLLNNPCNPTGAVYTREELKALLDAAEKLGLFVVADEVYSELVYEGKHTSCAHFPHRNTLIVESCSKNFAMAGWRVGFAFGPKEILATMAALLSQTTTGTCLISQRAALAALRNSGAIASRVQQTLKKRRDLFYSTYNRLFGTNLKPVSSAIYFLMKVEGNSLKACQEILEKAHVALVPGSAFGIEGYARIAFSEKEEDIQNGLEALARFFKDRPGSRP